MSDLIGKHTFIDMTTPYDPACIPRQIVLGICLDCDCTRALTRLGKCSICGSDSIIKKGAIKELGKQLRMRIKAIDEVK